MRRAAVIAYHSSPLLEPGRGDAGGMTVYVREIAQLVIGQERFQSCREHRWIA